MELVIIGLLQNTGMVIVKTTPEKMKEVASFMSAYISRATRSVALKVDIYDVIESSSSSYGMSLNLKLNGLLKTEVNTSNIPSGLSSTIASSSDSGVISGKYNDSNVILNALQSFGKVTSHTTQMAYTVNAVSTALDTGTSMSYVKERNVDTSTSGTSDLLEVSLTPGTVDTGFNLKLTPYISPNNDVLLNMSLIMSKLSNLRQVLTGGSDDSAGGYVELPTVNSKSFAYTSRLSSGEGLVIAAFNDDSENQGTASLAGEKLWFLGGNKGTSKEKIITIIIVTPYLVNNSVNAYYE